MRTSPPLLQQSAYCHNSSSSTNTRFPQETIKHAAARASALPSSLPASQQLPPKPQAPPLYPGPPLSESSVALKWEGPVSTNTRAAVAGCLWVLAQAPEACAMMRPRLAASRLAVLVAGALEEDRGAVAAGGWLGSGLVRMKSSCCVVAELLSCMHWVCMCVDESEVGSHGACGTGGGRVGGSSGCSCCG